MSDRVRDPHLVQEPSPLYQAVRAHITAHSRRVKTLNQHLSDVDLYASKLQFEMHLNERGLAEISDRTVKILFSAATKLLTFFREEMNQCGDCGIDRTPTTEFAAGICFECFCNRADDANARRLVQVKR